MVGSLQLLVLFILLFLGCGEGVGQGDSNSQTPPTPSSSLGPVEVSVTGITPQRVGCRLNEQSPVWSQQPPRDTTWSCEELGVIPSAGDTLCAYMDGTANQNTTPIGGSVTGLLPLEALCRNSTTNITQTISLHGATSWDCTAAGFFAQPGDRIRTVMMGTVVPRPANTTCKAPDRPPSAVSIVPQRVFPELRINPTLWLPYKLPAILHAGL